jgi:hypothetical protein
MQRRNFIIIGTAGLAAAAIPTAFYFFKDIEYDPSIAGPESLSLIWDPPTIEAIGKQYRLQTPKEDSERSLAKKLLSDAPGDPGKEASTLADKVITDYETGNTVIIDGWILSKTEARQCALFSIINPK